MILPLPLTALLRDLHQHLERKPPSAYCFLLWTSCIH